MENDLHQAFYGVFCSSKEIIKNNQRHLYVNMLDLLCRTCRATGLAESKIGADNLVKFWLEDILALVFDNDNTIQSCAVSTMEEGLSLIEISTIHNSKHWPQLRNHIVANLPNKIHELRTNKNQHWHQIWCLIIRILDREILNGASVINSFLSTVELGFRSSDCNVRSETFLCWRLLIKIFHDYNELLTPKRLKLICIPLKSTQSKSATLANVKIRVWWYFITCIGEKLDEHFSKVVEPFLTYAFGSPNRDASGDVQQYENIQILAVLCLAQILLEEQDELIDILINENGLETLKRPSPLLNTEILKENWKPLIHAIINAMELFSNDEIDSENREAKQHLRNWLALRLIKITSHLNYAPCTKEVCQKLIKFLPQQTLPLSTALNDIASSGFTVDTSLRDIENFSDVFSSILSLLIAGKPFVTAGVLQRCVDQIGKILQLFEREQIQQQALCAIIKVVCSSKDDDDFGAFETRLLCWTRLTQTIINYLSDKNLSYRQKDFAEIINDFILWPLRQFASFAGRCQTNCFNDDFCALWRQLLLCGQNAPNRENFLYDVQKALRELTSGQNELPFSELVNAYVAATLKFDSGKNSTYIKDILIFLRDLIEQPNITATKSFEIYLNTLRNVFLHMKYQELCENFELVKMSIAHVVNIVAKAKLSNAKVFTDWKQGILERFRSLPQKNYSTQIREIFKNDDVFVIIPNVWMLNPEKLTERQKERFAERSDIPALYNDMSQSQDSSIKPWTPNKVVIAKKDQTEIVIGSSQADEQENENSKNTNCGSSPSIGIRCTRKRSSKQTDSSNENIIKSKNLKPLPILNAAGIKIEDVKPSTKSSTDSTSTELTTTIRTRKSLRSKLEDVEQNEIDTNARISVVKSPIKSKQAETNLNQIKKSNSNEFAVPQSTPLLTSSSITRKSLLSQDTQLNTETQIPLTDKMTPTDEMIPETPTPTPTITALPEENIRDTEINSRTDTDTMEMNLEPKETSPKKSSTKIVGLSSPPDRKSTNNTCSPSLRPKPTPHLTRGAQLINMIRSKMKVDSPATSSVIFGASRSSIQLNKTDKRESTPVSDAIVEPIGFEHTSTPLQKKEFLTFRKRLPSPSASPSASILKRKLRRDSLDDISAESPATKRKRVSFHDPPVSLTKEYVRDNVEDNVKPKRCLALDRVNAGQASEIKHALKRRSKIDSMVEIESFTNESSENHIELPSTSSARKMSLNFEEQNNSQSESVECDPSRLPATETQIEILPDVETALKVVRENCSLEHVLELYFSDEKTATTKVTDTLAKFVSKCMTTNSKVKTSVLEVLSENHSKDFLDHAVQENLSSVVCDRLNLDSVIDYICAKSKLNTGCRNNLLTKIPDILKHSKVEKEPFNFIETLIKRLNPNDTTILDLISDLMRMRQERLSSSTPDLDSTDVSSSNL